MYLVGLEDCRETQLQWQGLGLYVCIYVCTDLHYALCLLLSVECGIEVWSQLAWSGRPQVPVHPLQEGVPHSSGRGAMGEQQNTTSTASCWDGISVVLYSINSFNPGPKVGC